MTLPFDIVTQEYVKVIYLLERENRVARVTDIADKRGVTKSSVSLVLQSLQKKDLVERKQYGFITLTASGKRLGITLLRRHQTIRAFLVDVLGVSPHTADDDACKIEHVISQETWKSMRRHLSRMKESDQLEPSPGDRLQETRTDADETMPTSFTSLSGGRNDA